MKKWIAVSAGLLFFTGMPAFAAPENIVVSRMQGQAQILRGTETLPAKTGVQCKTGDRLKTSSGCNVDLALNDLAGCRVLPSSECVISSGGASGMKIQIKSGNAILNLKKLPAGSTFEVETPTAVAAVRGTQFWGRVDTSSLSNPVTTFAVRQGTVQVFVKSAGETFSLQKGQALDIPKQGPGAPVIRPAMDAELQAMEQASTIKTSA